jgi:hypothetical protein
VRVNFFCELGHLFAAQYSFHKGEVTVAVLDRGTTNGFPSSL